MIENNNIPDANQSWNAAEKLIDKHFRTKKLRRILLFISVPTLILLGLFFIPAKKNPDYKQNLSNEIQQSPGSAKSINQADEIKTKSTIDSNSINNPLASDKNTTDQVGLKSNINNNSWANSTTVVSAKQVATKENVSNSNSKINKENLNDEGKSVNQKSTSNQTSNSNLEAVSAVVNTQTLNTSKANTIHSENSVKHKNEMDLVVTPKNNKADNTFETRTAYNQPADNIKETDLMLTSGIKLLNTFASSLPVKSKLENAEEKSWLKVIKNSHNNPLAWEASLTGGIHSISKSLELNSDWNNYLLHRKNEEDAIVAPSIGIAVSATYKSLSLSMGVEYAAYGERTNYYPFSIQPTITETSGWSTFITNYVDIDTAYITGNQLLLQTIRQIQDSNFVVVRDTIEEYKYDEEIAKTNGINHSYYLELPIEISYCLNRGRVGFGISGGVAPAMLTTQNGHYLRTEGKGIESLSDIKTFRKYLFNARLSADFYYRFSGKAKLVLRPQIRSNLNSVFENDYGVKQKYFSTGVLFGVAYMLN